MGIVLSGAIALSSTTLLGNALAGIMLRATRSFRIGDFVEVKDCFGRVSSRGLLHIEVQVVDRSLVTLPNNILVTNPVKVIPRSGTIISAEVSLGYDVSRTQVEALLIDAANSVGLEEAYVQIRKLGDFSVSFMVNGLLKDISGMISKRSQLHGAVMDSLHQGGIEIVSPNFMNTREVNRAVFIPPPGPSKSGAYASINPQS